MQDWLPFWGLPLWVWLFVLPTGAVLLGWHFRAALTPVLRPLWRLLDGIYLVSGVIAASFMVTILLLIVAQMVARWSGVPFHGSTEYAGYAMACTTFFALAHTLTRGGHIRVSIFLNLSPVTARVLDPLALFVSAITATYFARFAIKTNGFSVLLNDRTQGQDQVPEWLLTLASLPTTPLSQWSAAWAGRGADWVFTPLWLPQLAMSIGATLLAICLWDMLLRRMVLGQSPIRSEALE